MCLLAFCDAVERTGKVDAPYRMIGAAEQFSNTPLPLAAEGPQPAYTIETVKEARMVADKAHHEQVEAKHPRARRGR